MTLCPMSGLDWQGKQTENNSEAGSLSKRTKGNINLNLGSLSVIEAETERDIYTTYTCVCVYVYIYIYRDIYTHAYM